jgi:hypothetical protein
MEINYDLIIKYLASNKQIKFNDNKFITQKNIFNYSNTFPDPFNILLSEKFYRYGVTIYDNDNNNISFWSSLLTLLEPDYNSNIHSDELIFIHIFKNNLLDKYKKSSLSIKTLEKEDIRERMRIEPDCYLLQYIVDILNINIIIFDFNDVKIYALYNNENMNPFRYVLLFAKYNSYWEPIMNLKSKGLIKRLFNINEIIIKKLLYTSTIQYFNNDIIKKTFSIASIDDIVKQEKNKISKLINEISSNKELNNDIFIKPPENDNIYNKTILNKKKMDELHKICDELNITYHKKIKKNDLINTILNLN